MGKRKSARKPVAKVRQRLDKQFSCIFCNHEKSIEVKLDKESKVGNVMCRVCSANWQTSINYLSEPVDVYSEWIDACEAAQQEDARANYDEDDRDRSDYGRSTNSRGYNDNDEDDGDNSRSTSANRRNRNEREEEEEDEEEDDPWGSGGGSRGGNTSKGRNYDDYDDEDDEEDDGLFG